MSVAWQLARAGASVTILEKDRAGRASSYVAAGMLAPQAEMGFDDIEMFRLCRRSLDLYPEFLRELEEDSGVEIKLERSGCILPALDRDDHPRLRRLYDFRERINLPVVWLNSEEARETEPMLSPNCSGAIWIEDDAQINNREMLRALQIAVINKGVTISENMPVRRIDIKLNQVAGVETDEGYMRCEYVIICAGAWSKMIEGIPDNILPPVRPVKGQIVNLRQNSSCGLKKVIRARDVYLLPKSDGRIVVGASCEEMGFDTSPTAGEVFRLLERAWEAVPSIYDLPIESIEVGLRPGSKDHMPIVGDTEVNGLYYATGHYRNGILLAPVTAYELSEWILSGNPSQLLRNFNISRFYGSLVN